MRYIQYRPDILATASLSIKPWEAVPKLTNDCPCPSLPWSTPFHGLYKGWAQCKLTLPPATPLLMTGYIHWVVDSPKKMTRRSPFQEGEGGVQRGKLPQFWIHQLGAEFPLDHHNNHQVLHWAGPDMGQLITALTSGLWIGTPKISTFSGNVAPGKTEVSYEQWSHEVQCIKDHYPELVVRESIMQSLKGAAADMAHYMGPTASVSKILEKLSVIFGTVACLLMC